MSVSLSDDLWQNGLADMNAIWDTGLDESKDMQCESRNGVLDGVQITHRQAVVLADLLSICYCGVFYYSRSAETYSIRVIKFVHKSLSCDLSFISNVLTIPVFRY